MNIKDSPTGKIVKALTGYHFFIPNPLPPTFEWDHALVNSLSRADRVLGMLAGEGAKAPGMNGFYTF